MTISQASQAIQVTADNLKSVMAQYKMRFERREDEDGLILTIKGKTTFAGEVVRCHDVSRGYWGAYIARCVIDPRKGCVQVGAHSQAEAKVIAVQKAIAAFNLG